MFVNGDLRGKFIMDRNLGARDTNRSDDGTGVLHYQFGRKDPFPTDGATTHGTPAYIGNGGDEDKWSVGGVAGPALMLSAVNNPMAFIKMSGNWASEASSETYVWHDFETDVSKHEKSIFDPSPKGWKVPHIDVWSSFSNNTMTDWVSSAETSNFGRSLPLSDDKFAYYPPYGLREAATGEQNGNFSLNSFSWGSTPSNADNSYILEASPYTVTVRTTSGGRSHGMLLRPVQHNEE